MAEPRQVWVAVLAVAAAVALGFHFVQLRHGEEAARGCAANLEQIRAAVEQFALDHDGAAPGGWRDLIPRYLDAVPTCPGGGEYSTGDLTTLPACSLDGHAFPASEP